MSGTGAAFAGNIASSSEAIDPEILKIVRLREVHGSRSLSEWVLLLDQLARIDIRNESTGRKTAIGGIASAIVTALLVALATELRVPWVMVSALVVGALAAYLLARTWQLRKRDLNDGFRTTIAPFLKIIAEDLDARRPVELKLDLSGPTKDKIVSKEKVPNGRFSKVVRTTYTDRWCRLVARLSDHGKLYLEISDVYLQDTRRSRTGGKIKWKKVWKKKANVTAGLIPGAELVFDRTAAEAVAKNHKALVRRVGGNGESTDLTGKFRLKVITSGGLQFGKLTCQFKFKAFTDPPKESVSPDDLIRMYFQLASMLRPARRGGIHS